MYSHPSLALYSNRIELGLGIDATKLFTRAHTQNAFRLLSHFLIGVVDPTTKEREDESPEDEEPSRRLANFML